MGRTRTSVLSGRGFWDYNQGGVYGRPLIKEITMPTTSIKIGHETCEVFTLSRKIRWVIRDGEKVLQQAWQGSEGSVQWEDVPTEEE